MRLWTIQPPEFYSALCRDGIIHCNPDLSELLTYNCFQNAYDWLSQQMVLRIGPPPVVDVKYPIWAWHSLYQQHKKPDLRRIEFRGYSGQQLCIEIEIPDGEVLLSDNESWDFVLNDCYFCQSQEFDLQGRWLSSLSEEEQKRITEKSWERIFDHTDFENNWSFVQATFWELKREQVIDVREFNNRV